MEGKRYIIQVCGIGTNIWFDCIDCGAFKDESAGLDVLHKCRVASPESTYRLVEVTRRVVEENDETVIEKELRSSTVMKVEELILQALMQDTTEAAIFLAESGYDMEAVRSRAEALIASLRAFGD